jgi:putative ABC transport system permease protein
MRIALLLGLRTLARERRSGDLAVMFLALLVAVAALTGVGFLVDRIERAMRLQANEVLAGDLRVRSTSPLDAAYAAEAARRGLDATRVTQVLTVVLKGDATQLASMAAAAPGYPLRGKVQVADEPFGTPSDANGIPARGEAWPDSRLLSVLGARIGDTISVGSTTLRVSKALLSRPDQGSGFVNLAPSLLINEADLPATGLIQPGSRVQYATMFAGERGAVDAFAAWFRAQPGSEGVRLLDISEVSAEVGTASARAGRFLSLASLVGVLLCAVAIAMTARRYVKRHLDLAALLKTLGATRGTVVGISLVQLLCIALLAAAAGALAGFLAQSALLVVVKDMIATTLPPPGWRPLLMGFATALLLLMGCALPPMLQLARVPAIRVLRRDIGPPPLATLLAYGPAALAIALLVQWVTRDAKLSLGFIAGLALAVVALALAGWLLVALAGRMRAAASIAWRYGAANLARRRTESILQIVALGLGLSALLLLTIVRGNLVEDWRARLPNEAPNYFFVNIPSAQREEFAALLEQQGARTSRLMPMIRGRLQAINGEDTSTRHFVEGRGEELATREQNLSWSEDVGASKVTEGHWFTPAENGLPLVSVATEFQQAMGLKLGDRLTFDIAGESVDVMISSFREVQWDSLQPNFFLMFAPGLLDGAAGTWMAGAVYRPQSASGIADIVRRFPGVSIFDVDQLVSQVRSIIDKAVIAVQSVFLFTLLAGIVVLLAAVQATRDERRFESAMLRALGAQRRMVRAGVLVEFALLGIAAGVIAAAVAAMGGYLLAERVLEIPYRMDPLLWITGSLAGAVLVCAAGWLATRSALAAPPMQVLRQG